MKILVILCVLHAFLSPRKAQATKVGETVVYGKYYHKSKDGKIDRMDNSYYLAKPPVNIHPGGQPHKFPVMFQSYGTAWRRPGPGAPWGPFTRFSPVIGMYNERGIAFVSIGYRGINAKYWYDEDGTTKEEELVHVDSEGRLTLDSTGLTMADYRVRASSLELIPKCIYDTVQALENLIANADSHGIDVHRILMMSSSAGTVEINYLAWVYHKWNKERFTPLGMLMSNPQFDLPVFSVNSHVMKQWMDHADEGPNMLVERLVHSSDCWSMIGNVFCEEGFRTKPWICNLTANDEAVTRYCDAGKEGSTIGQVYRTQTYEVSPGLKKLWYISQNMLDYQPKPFNLFAASFNNGIMHGSAFLYGEIAARAGIDYTVYYLPHTGMRKTTVPVYAAQPEEKFGKYLVRSSINWLTAIKSQHFQPESPEEHLLFACHVLGIPSSYEIAPSRQLSASAATALLTVSV